MKTEDRAGLRRTGQRLLVVDDDPLNVDMLARRLERAGFVVERAASGREALDRVEAASPDLVLLDHNMPEMTGIEVLSLLRKTYSSLDLPVIMVTAVNDSQVIADALHLGANDYITKPVDFVVVMARIDSHLERRAAERELVKRERRDATAARGSNDGLWDWDLESNEMYFSPRWTEILGYTESELEKNPAEWFGRIHPEDSNSVQRELEATIQGSIEQFESEHRLLHKDRTWRWVRSRAKAAFNECGKTVSIAGTLTDITAGKSADPLTNLPNRSTFVERLADAIAHGNKGPDYRFAVLIVNVDRFKVINEGLGHSFGDELLIAISQRLRRMEGEGVMLVARLRADEFAILVDHRDAAEQVSLLGERIQEVFARPFRLAGRDIFCTTSIGVALCPKEGALVEDLLRDADTAMYHAKALGGGRLEIFDAEMRRRAVERLELEIDLRRSLETHDFEVHYQPKVCLSDNHVIGVEALVRWRHPRLGLMYPNDFIPLAEETGLIVPLGMWVMEQAAKQLSLWQAQFPRVPPIAVSVNVSCRQFLDPNLVSDIQRILKETGLDPSSLHVEVTESVFIHDTNAAVNMLEKLKSMGLGLKMDDFGTGYSSLSSLSRMPFDSVKIDKSFVANLGSEGAAEIIKTVIDLAGTLGMTVIAEGVETRSQLEELRSLGCDYAQGFYFSKPVRPAEIEKILSESPQNWLPAYTSTDLAALCH